MLTRLKVSGFKNLVDVDISFGPFTCIAGANGVGKSNLFDAIQFLSALAEKPFREAAMSVRDNNGTPSAIKSLFHRHGEHTGNKMTFEAEMIVPKEGIDELGQEIKTSNTLLKYSLELIFNESKGGIELLKEELVPIKLDDVSKRLLFPHESVWRDSILIGNREKPLISTEENEHGYHILAHVEDCKGFDREMPQMPATGFSASGTLVNGIPAKTLPRTVLSTLMDAAQRYTTIMAKKEMQSWRLMLLNPLLLREPDKIGAPTQLGDYGSYLPSTLYRIAAAKNNNESRVYQEIANRLSELIDDVSEISVDRDDKRELMTLELTDRSGTKYTARDLSDGTLRFLAAAVIEADEQMGGLICFEEPENGIHPARIPAMIKLLKYIATDATLPVEEGNPLRQVIINTHSPAVVAQVPDDSLLIAELREIIRDKKRFKAARFGWLPDTWRATNQPLIEPVCKGTILSYLNPVPYESEINDNRVIDRKDIKEYLPSYPED
ncbi:AAA family ATPase [Candidatus Magnetominusculus xianensis]|uniref:Recombination protein F n=1 Tax=Candidatus Magnetominusculus xianensis TaxID=1748249 RepID=A0ABR5SJG6_9BACT|nr:AAA family ATPase [Candidatus Magnetominusculus xianensis]KWT92699.1 recombination protein F [Candidatus Magnetominusculus xianensis]MBF0403750.1 AAA family ATPase [Nitrospirota bacterium]